ncbi:heat shock protein 26-like [Drosophila hydei]|uniref:Heat shock protein 26-like n=1 Tax=Drosophila hydei TaxID=7224 RepID=A0A6J1LE38_DROHY|nr:heat shock protein 26-like [Drosophila hydei]
MSLSHLITLVDALSEPRNPVYDFGMGMNPRHFQTRSMNQSLLSPWQCPHPECPTSPVGKILASRRGRGDMTKLMNGEVDAWSMPIAQVGKDGYQVCMDVAQFTPRELNVKVADNWITIEGKHEEREDGHGYISRHFVRRYALPKGFDGDKVVSSLSSDGILSVSVPKPKPTEDKTNERVVQIQQVGPAHLNIKRNEEESKAKTPTNGSSTK